jgi:hypothetical protein
MSDAGREHFGGLFRFPLRQFIAVLGTRTRLGWRLATLILLTLQVVFPGHRFLLHSSVVMGISWPSTNSGTASRLIRTGIDFVAGTLLPSA